MDQSLTDDIRVRLRRDPGDSLVVDGRVRIVRWPEAFVRVGEGLFAEIVLSRPPELETFPAGKVDVPVSDLLLLAWTKTVQAVRPTLESVEAGLPRPVLAASSGSPLVTGLALRCAELLQRPDGSDAGALVAVPSRDSALFYPLHALDERAEAVTRLSALAAEAFSRAPPKSAVSPHAYLSLPDQSFRLVRQ